MNKTYLVTIPIMLLSALNANPQNNGYQPVVQTQNSKDINTSVAKAIAVKKVSMQDFPHLQMMKEKYRKMDKRERKMRLNLEEAKMNYDTAINNFNYVLDVKTLIEDIHHREECYIAYYRIKELDQKLKTSSELDTIIYHKIKNPLEVYLSKCGKLKLDTLNKYKNIKGK